MYRCIEGRECRGAKDKNQTHIVGDGDILQHLHFNVGRINITTLGDSVNNTNELVNLLNHLTIPHPSSNQASLVCSPKIPGNSVLGDMRTGNEYLVDCLWYDLNNINIQTDRPRQDR